MGKATRLTVEQRANLVAYLDGELDEAETRSIEETLAGSPAARRDIEMLSRAWDLLDHLPRVDPGEEFTQRTVSRLRAVEVDKAQTSAQWRIWLRRGLVSAIWLGVLIVAVVGGVYAAVYTIPSEGQRMIRDFPVVEQLDQYEAVGSLEFLEELKKNHLFDEGNNGDGSDSETAGTGAR
ncbi:hypothetical protein CA54_10040 [Symmachiella macrocystis]|uniref:Zinc-finger domain-containing protein n=1 Tax=Symmachiella macrocystis TaxID=2527985 RepID=A0A5C6BLK3_9PLAN|nr:hypothetical protein [Symmachiella macrocystis]TWU12186.1 hypothetical protein CA54_10040 [Symmachiella macrocystis]